jgi:hypothetical protein
MAYVSAVKESACEWKGRYFSVNAEHGVMMNQWMLS